MATNSMTTAHSDEVLNLLRGTSITAPGSVDIALHKASTLAGAAASGQAVVSMNHSPAVGSLVTLDPDNAAAETKTVSTVSGSGPYTVTMTTNLSNAHSSGAYATVDPLDDLSKLIEVSGGAYARQNIVCNTSNFAAPSNGSAGRQTSNSNALNYPQATADWGYVDRAVVYNSATGWYYGAPSNNIGRVVRQNDTYSIPAGALVIQQD